MEYVIKYVDGAYEHREGTGFPSSLAEAKIFESKEDAERYANDNLDYVLCIEEIPSSKKQEKP